jgi:hypothetical protein
VDRIKVPAERSQSPPFQCRIVSLNELMVRGCSEVPNRPSNWGFIVLAQGREFPTPGVIFSVTNRCAALQVPDSQRLRVIECQPIQAGPAVCTDW